MFPLILFWVGVLLCVSAAYFIANAICQRSWKEKVPQSKLIGFTSVFVVSFALLAFLTMMASMMAFGR